MKKLNVSHIWLVALQSIIQQSESFSDGPEVLPVNSSVFCDKQSSVVVVSTDVALSSSVAAATKFRLLVPSTCTCTSFALHEPGSMCLM